MNLLFNLESAKAYKSTSQQARVLTEGWVLREIYCPSCGDSVNDYDNNKTVSEIIKTFPKHACQFCGCERKLVETIIDDEFFWDDVDKMYQPNKFMDNFEHTGNNRCTECGEKWTGL